MQEKRARMGAREQLASVLHGQHNGNFARSTAAHRRDIKDLTAKGEGVKVLAVQELKNKIWIPGYETIQTDQTGHVGEALFIHKSIKILKAGVVDASPSNFGEAIGNRGIPWAWTQLPDGTRELDICWHNVPLRMQDTMLDEVGERAVRRIINKFRATPFVVHTDANQLERADPADLKHVYGSTQYGDGIWVGPRIDLQFWGRQPEYSSVIQWWTRSYEARGDNHPTVFGVNRKTIGLYELNARGKVVVKA